MQCIFKRFRKNVREYVEGIVRGREKERSGDEGRERDWEKCSGVVLILPNFCKCEIILKCSKLTVKK